MFRILYRVGVLSLAATAADMYLRFKFHQCLLMHILRHTALQPDQPKRLDSDLLQRAADPGPEVGYPERDRADVISGEHLRSGL